MSELGRKIKRLRRKAAENRMQVQKLAMTAVFDAEKVSKLASEVVSLDEEADTLQKELNASVVEVSPPIDRTLDGHRNEATNRGIGH
jgi:uncharacterized protein Yka (UPF0111/DUF47 family)